MTNRFNSFHHIDLNTISEMYDNYTPVFVLSTGRSGTRFIHHSFSQVHKIISYHEAFPTLQFFSNFAFHNQNMLEVLEAKIQAARMELILDAYNQDKIYVESNQCLVFYAYAITKIWKNAKFIHLIRHPGDFIRSAIMKGWHKNDSIWEAGRVKMSNKTIWSELTHIEKLAWVWITTNSYINTFFSNIDQAKALILKFEDIISNEESLSKLFKFARSEYEINADTISKLQLIKVNEIQIHKNEPPNMKKIDSYPLYNDWPEKHKEMVRKIVGSFSALYGYEI